MGGEDCDSLELEARGVAADRLIAIRNAAGKFGSGADTNRFRRINGHCLRGDDDDLAADLSSALGQALILAREADISHFDEGPVHLLTTAILGWLGRSGGRIRQRPPLQAEPTGDVAGSGPEDQDWIGRRLRIGSSVELLLRGFSQRCCTVAMLQGELGSDP
jgi:hypothetical protein